MSEYVNDGVYQTLVRICESAGIKVKYCTLDNGIYAQTRDAGIKMPDEDNFRDSEHAALVLGHELAHHFVGEYFVNTEQLNTNNCLPMHVLIESECDRLGAYLYMLAEKIAIHKAEAVWRDRAE